jgi:hypothetical protein
LIEDQRAGLFGLLDEACRNVGNVDDRVGVIFDESVI